MHRILGEGTASEKQVVLARYEALPDDMKAALKPRLPPAPALGEFAPAGDAVDGLPDILDRMDRLREAGLGDDELGRLRSPIGLDLGARTPEETAISIAAEIVAGRWGGSGEPLGVLSGRIHA